MIFGSVCSGIEAASLASLGLGWEAAWLSEVEPFPCALLAARWPWVPNLGDMQKLPALVSSGSVPAPDLLIGGTPCQAFSLAGLRNGLSDSRGALSLTYVELINAIDTARAGANQPAAIALWENVPGVLSSKDNAFGCFLAGLAGEDEPLEPPGEKWSDAGCVLGPQRAVAWRCLDAQYFGLAQRRKRVFVIASAREGFDPAKVLFEFDGVRRDSPPSRETGQEVTPTIDASAGRRRGSGMNANQLVAFGGNNTSGPIEISPALNACASASGRQDFESECFVVRTAQTSSNGWGVNSDTAYTLDGANGQAVAFAENSRAEVRLEGGDGQIVGTLLTGGGKPGQGTPTIAGVRRLTPVECERLQGFPDDYTAVPFRGRPAADGPRYKALGNSMAVPVMVWICKRINNEVKL